MYDYLFHIHEFAHHDKASDEKKIKAFIAEGAAMGYRLCILESDSQRVSIVMERKSEPLK